MMTMVETLAPDDIQEDALSADALHRGTRLGRYELLLAIAKGGMARVWAARQHGQRGFSKTVAIKTILPHLAEEPEFERMFLDEARIAALVHHPNVAEIYELGEEGKVLYIAMEWVNGESLIQLLRSSGKMAPMDARLAARIVADACAGLHAAHNLTDDDGRPMGVVHRDVSPHNILVSADGHVKVADFGVAKALGQMHSATVAGQVKGKMAYMAPEQITGGVVDRRSDVFAMGIVLYEATTGSRPYTGANDAEVMHAALKGTYTPPTRILRSYPPELEQIIAKAMDQDPTHRYATAEKMRIAIEEWLAKSGAMVTQSQVGAFVQARVGATLDKRRDKIRAAANAPVQHASGDHSASGHGVATPPVSGTPSVQSAVREVDQGRVITGSQAGAAQQAAAPQGEGPSGMKYVLAGLIGVIVAGLIGVVAILVARRNQTDDDVARATPTVSAKGPTSSPLASAAPGLKGPVSFVSLPPDSVLIVDGMMLDHSVRTLDRPAPGTQRKVVVRTPGYEDETVNLDGTTPATLELTLTFGSLTSLPSAATATVAATAPAGSGSAKKPNVPLPLNPY